VSRDAEFGDARDSADETVEPTGKFRIYLGAVAGVGKTWAMLDEGWRRYKRGADVVVGFVETHGRAHTAEQIRDLEVVPRKKVDYRGTTFEEMDLEAVIARKPEVASSTRSRIQTFQARDLMPSDGRMCSRSSKLESQS